MVKTIIVVGKKQVIDKNPGSESFYNFLAGYFTGKGHDTTRVRPEEFNESAVGAEYFVGHSAGTTPILQGYTPETFPNLKGIVLFDPNEGYREVWNSITIPKVSFVSTIFGRPYSLGFNDSVLLKDGHFFLNSFGGIEDTLDKLLSIQHVRILLNG